MIVRLRRSSFSDVSGLKKDDHNHGCEQRECCNRQQRRREAIGISDHAGDERREKRNAHVGSVNHRHDAAGEILRRRFHRRRNDHRTKRPEEGAEGRERYGQEGPGAEVRNGNDDGYAGEREGSDQDFVAETIANPTDESRCDTGKKVE